MPRYEFCKICHGITKHKCWFCDMSITDYKKIDPPHGESQVKYHQYLRETWVKCRRYKMLTTGVFSLDEQLHQMWGAWRGQCAAETMAREVLRGIKFPEQFRGTELGTAIETFVVQLSADKIVALLEVPE